MRAAAFTKAFGYADRLLWAGSCLSRTGGSILGVVYALPVKAVYSRLLPIAMSHRRRGVLIVYPNRLLLAVVAVAVLFGIGSCSTTPHRTSEERAGDADIEAKVVSALKMDHSLYSEHIDVVVDRGVVHLKGFVYSDHERLLAQTDAESVTGVQSVDIELDLMGGGISEASD